MPPVRLNFFVGNLRSFFLIAITLCVAVFLFVLPGHALAQNTTQQVQTRSDPFSQVDQDVPRNHHSFAQVALIDISSAILCQLIGIDIVSPSTPCLGINEQTKKIGYVQPETPGVPQIGGVIGMSSNLIGGLYTPPISTGVYVQYLADNFGIVKPAHAQNGAGFDGIQGTVLDLYTLTRNIVYLLLVVLFIIIGIAIMIRVKIDPRTVMSVQNQIPKLIMGIIMITFSFAFAGLLIDVMWTITYFSINAMTRPIAPCTGARFDVDIPPGSIDLRQDKTNPPLGAVATRDILNNPVAFVTDIFGDDTGCFGSVDGISGLAIDVGKTLGDVLSRTLLGIFGLNEELKGCNISSFIPVVGNGSVGDCVKNGIFGILKYLIGIIGSLVIGLAILINLIRIWFTLLKAYISIILGIILSPFWIILGLLPGGGLGFSQWTRHMVAHLALFPATALMLILAAIFAQNSSISEPSGNVFLPPLIGNPNIADGMGSILAFAFIMLTPDMMKIIRDALKTPQGKYTGNITGRAKVSPASAIGSAGSMAYNWQMARQLPLLNKIPGLKPNEGGTMMHAPGGPGTGHAGGGH